MIRRLAVRAATALALLSAAGPLAAQAGVPVVEKVDPPSWWAPSTVNPVRVMIRGKHLTGATLACGRLTCANVRVNATGTYVVRLTIRDSLGRTATTTVSVAVT